MGRHESEETYLAIGRFIYEFSQLEHTLRVFTGTEAGIEEEHFNAVMTHDFSLLCTVAQEVIGKGFTEDKRRRLADIIKEFRKLNDIRVRVAHGLWVPFQGGGTVHHLSRSTLKVKMSAGQAAELEKAADSASHFGQMFDDLMWE
jgi:hypothetical protein